jgi:hypothetical protein
MTMSHQVVTSTYEPPDKPGAGAGDGCCDGDGVGVGCCDGGGVGVGCCDADDVGGGAVANWDCNKTITGFAVKSFCSVRVNGVALGFTQWTVRLIVPGSVKTAFSIGI